MKQRKWNQNVKNNMRKNEIKKRIKDEIHII